MQKADILFKEGPFVNNTSERTQSERRALLGCYVSQNGR